MKKHMLHIYQNTVPPLENTAKTITTAYKSRQEFVTVFAAFEHFFWTAIICFSSCNVKYPLLTLLSFCLYRLGQVGGYIHIGVAEVGTRFMQHNTRVTHTSYDWLSMFRVGQQDI
jgi:hypothetical protein